MLHLTWAFCSSRITLTSLRTPWTCLPSNGSWTQVCTTDAVSLALLCSRAECFLGRDPVIDRGVTVSALAAGQYQDPWQYVDDIWLMFNNAWLYNRKTSRVYKYCSKLAEVFEQEIDPVMQSLGYCCGRKVRRNVGSSEGDGTENGLVITIIKTLSGFEFNIYTCNK